MARKKKTFKRVSSQEKAKILVAADRHGLTAAQVEKKFGVSRWTFYGWRKRTAAARRRGRPVRVAAAGAMHACNCAAELRTILPGLLREELTQAMRDLLLGGKVQHHGGKRKK